MISTTSPSPATRRARRSSPRARGRPVASAARSSSLSRRRAAAAADRTVSGRRAPGMATIAASRSSSQASAISAGVAPRAAATCAQAEFPGQAAGAAGSAERRVGHDDQPGLEATLDDTAAERGVVERAQRNLDRRQRSELERLVELRAIDVGDADARSQPVFVDPSERANRRPPRNPRVGSVQQIEVDRQAGERGQARFAVSPEGAGPPVRYPVAARSRHAALRDDPRQGRVASTESAGEQPLVVPELGLVAPVGPGGVEDGDAAIDSRGDRLDGALLLSVGVGREPHAAKADPQLGGVEPVRRGRGARGRWFHRGRRIERPSPSPLTRARPRPTVARQATGGV